MESEVQPDDPVHHTVPTPSHELQEGLKRNLEEDVQFVSSHPVKRLRKSPQDTPGRGSSIGQTSADLLGGNTTSAEASSCRGSTAPAEIPQLPRTAEPSVEMRGSSLPSMGHFTYPQFTGPMSTGHHHISPAISPKQMPATMPSVLPVGPTIPVLQVFDHLGPQDMQNQMGYHAFSNSIDALNGFQHSIPMTAGTALNQRIFAPIPQLQAAQHTSSIARKASTNDRPATPVTATRRGNSVDDGIPRISRTNTPRETEVHKAETARGVQEVNIKPLAAQTTVSPLNMPNPNGENMSAGSQRPNAAPNRDRTEASPTSTTQQQRAPLKQPCAICARLRQQALLKSANSMQPAHPVFMNGTTVQTHFLHKPPGNVPTVNASSSSPSSSQGVDNHVSVSGVFVNRTPDSRTSETIQPTVPVFHTPVLPPLKPAPAHGGDLSFVTHPITHGGAPAPHRLPTTASQDARPSDARAPPRAPSLKRKPPQNLIVDIAETCEEVFPFKEVAQRHSVPQHKVVEVFAAIIQLPLLRCVTDKRRHGKLASTRMKEFSKARKEHFQEASGAGGSNGNAHSESTGPMLPGVMELARAMPPMEYSGDLRRAFMGPW